MESGQGTTSKEINNSIRGAAIAIGVRPDTVVSFLQHMRDYDSGAKPNIIARLRQFEIQNEYLFRRIEELAREASHHYEEANKLREEIKALKK